MKDELQGKLVEILGSIQTAAGKAGDFAMAQLPEIAQSYVAYGRVSALIAIVGSMMGIGFAIWCAMIVKREVGKYEDIYDSNPMIVMPLSLVAGTVGLLSALSLIADIQMAALVWFAPKVWLLKEIAGMLK